MGSSRAHALTSATVSAYPFAASFPLMKARTLLPTCRRHLREVSHDPFEDDVDNTIAVRALLGAWCPRAIRAAVSIAFHSNRAGNNNIYVMNPDGSDQIRVTPDTEQ